MTKCYAHFEQVGRYLPSRFIGIKEGYTESYWEPGTHEKIKMKIKPISKETHKGYRGITTLRWGNCERCRESGPGGGRMGIYAEDSADAETKKIIEKL